MKEHGSRTARILAALILLPLLAVAGLVAFNLSGDHALEREAEGLAAALDRVLVRTGPPGRPGLAVLPLANATDRPALDYLAEGISADLRDQLAGFADLAIIGAQSSRNVASQSLPIASIARLLGVDHVLHGSVRGNEEALAIALELSQVNGSQETLWRETWDGTADGLPLTTRAVATRVVRTLLPFSDTSTAWPDEQDAPAGTALDDYLHGKYLIDRYNRDEVLEGIAFLERAIATSPDFERAIWAKIAGHQRMTWIDAQVATEHEALIDSTIDVYLTLDQETALTHRLHALRAANDNRPLDAFNAFQRAVQLRPHEYAFDRGYMMDLCKAGYLARCLEQARGLARADPVSAAAHTGLATVYFLLGDYERMLEHARLSERFGGDLAGYFEAQALLARREFGRAEDALAGALEAVGVSSDWVEAYVAGVADPGKTDAAVAAMRAVDDASAFWLDQFFTELVTIGAMDLAYEATEVLVAERYQTWNLYAWDPQMRPYRNDPRFIDVMRSMGLIEVWRALGLPDACVGDSPEPFCARIEGGAVTP